LERFLATQTLSGDQKWLQEIKVVHNFKTPHSQIYKNQRARNQTPSKIKLKYDYLPIINNIFVHFIGSLSWLFGATGPQQAAEGHNQGTSSCEETYSSKAGVPDEIPGAENEGNQTYQEGRRIQV